MTAPTAPPEVAVGDVRAAMFPRSSNKPMQAVGMLRSGAELTGRHLADAVGVARAPRRESLVGTARR